MLTNNDNSVPQILEVSDENQKSTQILEEPAQVATPVSKKSKKKGKGTLRGAPLDGD